MNTCELIIKKRNGGVLTESEIGYLIGGYVSGEIPDYQISALLMAIYFRGMNDAETLYLTREMIKSGDTLDLSAISGVKVDKHSTGGVGDKTSLGLCPLLAASGVKLAKMSGRGLGHTGGTIDKLESFPGFSTGIDGERFIQQVDKIGFAIAGQTKRLVPADKMLYALRDVTGTVDIIPLIVSSIMSKKLASGADIIALDVKCGSGAFMKSFEDAKTLAEKMVAVGKGAGKKTFAVISDMDEPLGCAVGNALEVKEAIDTLRGEGPAELHELCMELAGEVLLSAGICQTEREAEESLLKSLSDGSALRKLAEMVKAQGGDERAVFDTSLLPKAPVTHELISTQTGFVESINAEGVGRVCIHLGGGRMTKDSKIDLSVGVVLHKKVGDCVSAGESIATIHAADEASAAEAERLLTECYRLGDKRTEKSGIVRAVIK